MLLTEKQKREYREIGMAFMMDASILNEKVIKLEIEESELVKMIHDRMPKTLDGISFCNLCNVQSMIPVGYRNHTGTKNRDVSQPIYACEICGYVDIKPVHHFS